MFSPPPSHGDVFDLRIQLRDIEPPIWRVVRVPAALPLALVHQVLQVAFGWQDCHMHDFTVGELSFGNPEADDMGFCIDERAAPLGAVARAGSSFVYRYDFGDGWEHEVVVERVELREDQTFTCLGGAGACPPEDCGGPPGYERLLAALADPTHPEHAELKRWAPRRFDPEKFDAAAVNKKLASLFHRVARRASPRPAR